MRNGRPFLILLSAPSRIARIAAFVILERIRRGERIRHYQTIRQAKNRARLHISLTVSPIINSEGKIIGASKIARDIIRPHRLRSAHAVINA